MEAKQLRQAELKATVAHKPENRQKAELTIEILKAFETEFDQRMERPTWVACYKVEYPN